MELAAEAQASEVQHKKSAPLAKVDWHDFTAALREGRTILDFDEAVRNGRETMEEPLRLRNMSAFQYFCKQFAVKDLIVVPEETKSRPLSEGEIKCAECCVWYRIWFSPTQLQEGVYPFNRLETSKESITMSWNSTEPATFDVSSYSRRVLGFQISSYSHDMEDVYDIQPSYGLIFKSRQTIQVFLRRRLPSGSKDSLLIEVVDLTSKLPIFTGHAISRLVFFQQSTTHKWVDVKFDDGQSEKSSVWSGHDIKVS